MNKTERAAVLSRLREYDTPTICNAIEIVKGERQNRGFTTYPVVCLDTQLPPMVGFAKTVTIAAHHPATLSAAELQDIRFRYYDGLVIEPLPAIAVIADQDWPQPLGAMVGEITVATHKGLGLAGIITSGLMRDLAAVDKGFQVLAAAIGPSHAFVHFQQVGVPVTVLGMQVKPNDLIHADRHGAVIIKEEILPRLPDALEQVIRKEKIVLDAARRPGLTVAKLKDAWRQFSQ